MAQLIYNKVPLQDLVQVLSFIDEIGISFGIPVTMDINVVTSVVTGCNSDTFPHNGGVEKASVFKKMANFVCHFVAAGPILDPVPGYEFSAIPNHQNAVFAFELARQALFRAKIDRRDGVVVGVDYPILLSDHSYIDIIDALSTVTPVAHFKLVTVLFEQLVYKTNPHCQYAMPEA